MNDLFEREQKVLSAAMEHLDGVKNGDSLDIKMFSKLVREYSKMLKQLRLITKISDKTTIDLYAKKLDLLDKVQYDDMTGIYNRRFMEDNLSELYKMLVNSNGELSILMIDIDFFKFYNDAYGHTVGDECIKIIAKAIETSVLRDEDFAARYGGEEFIVILPNTDENGAKIIATRIMSNVRACKIIQEKKDISDYVTISIGGTTGKVGFDYSCKEFIEKADEALYISKKDGRNRYTFLKYTKTYNK